MIPRRSFAIALATTVIIAAGCGKASSPPPAKADSTIQTIEQSDDVPALPLPSEHPASSTSTAEPALVDLPFTPAISMDPVDGGKVSIRPDTPVAEFKDRIYYFRSEENRQSFLRNPDKYVRGSLSRY
jgi:YHS domain-containing protein